MDEWKTDFASKRYDSSSLCWRRVASIGPFENVKYFLAIFCKLSSFFSFSFWHGSIQSKVSVWLTVSHLMVGIFCQKKKQQKQFKQLSKNWIYWSHVPRCFPYNSNVRIGSNLIVEWIFFGKHSSGPLILLIISYNIQS